MYYLFKKYCFVKLSCFSYMAMQCIKLENTLLLYVIINSLRSKSQFVWGHRKQIYRNLRAAVPFQQFRLHLGCLCPLFKYLDQMPSSNSWLQLPAKDLIRLQVITQTVGVLSLTNQVEFPAPILVQPICSCYKHLLSAPVCGRAPHLCLSNKWVKVIQMNLCCKHCYPISAVDLKWITGMVSRDCMGFKVS